MSTGKLQLTNAYNVDLGTLASLVAAMQQNPRGRMTVAQLAEAAGISFRQAENLGSIARAFGLAEPVTYRPTPLANSIAAHDRFFDDTGTLWFLHYVVASEPHHIVWNRFANEFLPENQNFTLAGLRATFADLAGTHSKKSAIQHVNGETRTLLNAYTDQNFSRLAYLRAEGDGFALGYRESVPPLVLAACIARYRRRHRPGDTALPVQDLIGAPNSPGVICQIPEDRLRAGLEALKAEPGLSLESRADLDQVRLTDDTPDVRWMERYYESR